MPGRLAALACLFCLAMFLSPILLEVSQAQPSQGNWVINGIQVVQNESIRLNGNLTVLSGGNLTIKGVTLTMNNLYNGQYGILVQPGGSMNIYNSTITAANLSHRFSFAVQGSKFVMKGSALHGAGWCGTSLSNCGAGTPNDLQEGLTIQTDNAVLEHNLISGNSIGLILLGSYASITGNNFTSNDVSVMDLGGSNHDRITGNYFHQYSLFDTWEANIFNSNNNFIYNNTMTFTPPPVVNGQWPGTGGFNLNLGSSNNIISSNYLFDGQPIAGLGGSNNNNTVVNNRMIVQGDSAVYMQGSSYIRLLGNNITLIPKPVPLNVGGILLVNCPHSTVANNTMVGSGSGLFYPLFLGHSPWGIVLNNKFDVTLHPAATYPTPSVLLYASSNETIMGNVINGGEAQGIWLASGSDNNVITDNSVGTTSPRSSRSIVVDSSSDNLIYGNDFYDLEGPYDGGYGNAWSNSDHGNFWSYLQGSGPFKIPPNGVDLSPLPQSIPIKHVSVPTIVEGKIHPSMGTPLNLKVSGNSTIANTNEEISSGSIEIESGGRLVISNSTLILGAGFGMSISQGGSLIIKDSTLVGGSGIFEDLGANLTVLHSKLLVGQNETFAIFYSGAIIVSNSIIDAKGAFGYYFENRGGGNSSTALNIKNSALEDASTFFQLGGSIDSAHGNLLMNNVTMTRSFDDVTFSGDSATVINSAFSGAVIGNSISALTGTFSRNTVSDSPTPFSLSNGILQSNNVETPPPPLTAPPDPQPPTTQTTTTGTTTSTTSSHMITSPTKTTYTSTLQITATTTTAATSSTINTGTTPSAGPLNTLILGGVAVVLIVAAGLFILRKRR